MSAMATNTRVRHLLRPAAASLAGLLLMGPALAAPPTLPLETGTWVDDSGAGAVEIYICNDRPDRLCGRIVWLKEPLNAQGVPKRDRFNPNASLQTRPICGLPVLGNLAKVSGGFDGGWIYDPKVGKSYDAAIQLVSRDRLAVTGYLGMKFLSKNFTWSRAPADLQRCPTAPPPAVPPVPQETKATPSAQPDTKTAKASSAASAPAKASTEAVIVPPQPKPAVAPSKKTTPSE
jgi:uncharacterized protein (DUF2147 family)